MKGVTSFFYLVLASYLVFCVSFTSAFVSQRNWITACFRPNESAARSHSSTQLRAVYELGFSKDQRGADFKEVVLNSKAPVVVVFYSYWFETGCMMGPVFDKLSNEMPHVKFAKVNCDYDSHILTQYEVRGIPTCAMFVNGQKVAQQDGAMGEDDLKNFITRARRSRKP